MIHVMVSLVTIASYWQQTLVCKAWENAPR
jgi:hypothetical protein